MDNVLFYSLKKKKKKVIFMDVKWTNMEIKDQKYICIT